MEGEKNFNGREGNARGSEGKGEGKEGKGRVRDQGQTRKDPENERWELLGEIT